jgi:NTP pyrophosphatase (non-canonical NTP hydrolase)
MQLPKYTIPAYRALKSPTQEVQEHKPTLPPTSLHQAKTNYLLDKLQEEAAEVIQSVSKIRRFGEHNKHPDRDTTNKQELVNELEDFLAILAALEYCKYLDLTTSEQSIEAKAQQLLVP